MHVESPTVENKTLSPEPEISHTEFTDQDPLEFPSPGSARGVSWTGQGRSGVRRVPRRRAETSTLIPAKSPQQGTGT